MRLMPVYLSLTVACLVLTIGFSNCSKVGFDKAVIDTSSTTLATKGGAIVINNGNQYTNDDDVTLALVANSAEEMLVSDSADCSTGTWEKYASFKQWQLKGLNGSAKVYAKFREKAGGQETDCVSDDIIHDDIPPVIDIQRDIAGFSKTANVPFEFTATDAGSGIDAIDCQADASWTTGCNTAVKIHNLTEGGHFIRISARDRAGNVSLPRQSSLLVDLTPPTVVFNQTPPAKTADPVGVFAFLATDTLSGVEKYECRTGLSAWAACVSPTSASYPDGNNSYFVRAYDRAGNVSPEITYAWLVDKSVPSVRIVSGPTPVNNQTTATFTFDGRDGLGAALTVFECAIDGGAYTSCTSPKAYNGLTEGNHTFAVRGYNAVGTASAPATYTWMIDLTKPTVTLVSTPTNPSGSSTGTFVFTAQDLGSGVKETQCQIDGQGYALCSSPQTYLNLTEGNHTFSVRAVDNAGNVGDAVSYTYRIDLTKPTVTIVSGPAAQVKDMNAALVFTADDGVGQVDRIECQLDAEPNYSTCTSPKNYMGLAEGAHIFRVRAIDTVGLVSDVKTHAWFVDTLPPAINFGQTPPAVFQTGTATSIQYTVVDAGVGVETVVCGLNGVLAACPATDLKNYPTFAAGTHKFTVTATDKLGNAATQEITFTVSQRTQAQVQNVNVSTNNKVDVLVVIDNSGSMSEEQANMAARFGGFLDKLAGLDWQVGIVTTDVSSNANLKDGRLVQIKNKTNYILTSAMDLAVAKTDFAATIQRPSSEGSGNEQGIAATYRAIQRSTSTLAVNLPNNQLFRAGAALSVLVVTDADETNPNGTQTQNKPQELVNLINSTYPGKRFKFSSIIVKPGDSACKNQSNNEGYGYAYEALSTLTGGIVGTVCSQDYANQLAQVADATVDLINSVDLTCAPVDTTGDGVADVQITTADGSTPPNFTITGLKLNLSRALPAGNNTIRYTCIVP